MDATIKIEFLSYEIGKFVKCSAHVNLPYSYFENGIEHLDYGSVDAFDVEVSDCENAIAYRGVTDSEIKQIESEIWHRAMAMVKDVDVEL